MVAAPVVGVVAYFSVGLELAATSSIATLLGELLLSPDLDHCSGAVPYRLWGILRWIWIPYQRLVAHRSWSHWPIVGTAGRLAYVAAIPVLIVCLTKHDASVAFVVGHWRHFVAAAIGTEIAALCHIAADHV